MIGRALSGRTAIAGAATAGIGFHTDSTAAELMAEAAHAAIADAGVHLADVDAIFAVTPYYWMPSLTLAGYFAWRHFVR